MATQRKLGRPTDQRMAMLRNLTTSVLMHGRIETTTTRAKETKKLVDKMFKTLRKKIFVGNKIIYTFALSNEICR